MWILDLGPCAIRCWVKLVKFGVLGKGRGHLLAMEEPDSWIIRFES